MNRSVYENIWRCAAHVLRPGRTPSKPKGGIADFGPIRFVCVALLVSFPGCIQSDSHEGEDDHHMEHIVPEHKPANFAEAVDELQHRTEHLKSHIGDEDESFDHELEELTDIVGWIPELAADSDMNEADWNLADSISREMQVAFETSEGSGGLQSFLTAMQQQVESLEALVSRAGKPEPPIHHDDDHGDEDDEHEETEHVETDHEEQG